MSVIRLRSLTPIIKIIRQFELEPEDIIAPLGIDIVKLADPNYDDIIDLHKAYSLFEIVAEKTNCPYLGALIGCEEKLSILGPIGLLMEHSPDVKTALKVLLNNMRIQQKLADCQLETFGHSAWLTFTFFEGTDREGARHFIEAFIYTLIQILQAIIGPDFRPEKICFSHAAPEDVFPYRRLAMSKVSFSEEEYAIVFSKSYLERKKYQDNEDLSQALSNYLKLLREKSSNDLLTNVDYIIQRQLRSGPCTLQLVASELHVHPRNLQRQLKQLGTSFSETLAAYRLRRSIELLKDPCLQITQIAHRLGYSDATSFGQAFKKWSNTMPRDYRKQLNHWQ